MPDVKNDYIKILQDNRQAILFIELAGLLHDIGKLSEAFLVYRKTWHKDPKGYDNDPHDHDFLDKEDTKFQGLIPPGFETKIPINIFGEEDFSIKKAVHWHAKVDPQKDKNMKIMLMLKAADGIDAAIDRNNPLWSAEQKEDIFMSNIFGFEGKRIIPAEQEGIREILYEAMNEKLPQYFKCYLPDDRTKLFCCIKKAFNQGLSDTTRPQNDTTLWEHSYAVASILKCLAVHNLVKGDEDFIDHFIKVRFAILGVGWDGMRFMSQGHKIGDIVGRHQVIKKIKEEIKCLVEYVYPVGNEIYADDDGIYFVVPAELDSGVWMGIWNSLTDKINQAAADKSLGELQPRIELYSGEVNEQDAKKKTRTLTSLVKVINDLKEKRSYPFDASAEGFKHFADQLGKVVQPAENKTICPICRLRKVKSDNVSGKDIKKKICKTCEERRYESSKQADKKEETVFIDEIIIDDKNKNAAFIVARFGLDEWLNGKMVRSLFVTEANGLDQEVGYLGSVKQFEQEETKIKNWIKTKKYEPYNYQRIKDDIDAIMDDAERGLYTRLFYDRRVIPEDDGAGGYRYKLYDNLVNTKRNFEQLLKEAQAEHPGVDISLYNLLNAKTPTPSTILDVWNTTTRLFKDVRNSLSGVIEKGELKRLRLSLDQPIQNVEGRVLEADVTGQHQSLEIIGIKNNIIDVIGKKFESKKRENWLTQTITISGKEYKIVDVVEGDSYKPYRSIAISPNLFMAIVPADRALEVTQHIYDMYLERFGKVIGRLPFSIGNIFFKKDMPMFVVLDSAKRMIANFDRLSKSDSVKTFKAKQDRVETGNSIRIKLEGELGGLGRDIDFLIPCKLGDWKEGDDKVDNNDFYHPYLMIDGEPMDRKTFFETMPRLPGNVVHCSQIKKNDYVKLYLNYYDFEFLDANSRRYDITANDAGRRKSTVADYHSKPYLLDELNQKIMFLWCGLQKGYVLPDMTDTKLRNMLSLWLTKYQEWQVILEQKNTPAYQQWLTLVEASIKKQISSDWWPLISETLANGIFFDTMELYLGIMKKRIDDKKEETNDTTV